MGGKAVDTSTCSLHQHKRKRPCCARSAPGLADQQGVYVFAVEDGKAVVKRIKTGGESGPNIVVDEGLKGGEQIIVEGLQSIRPGQAVVAAPAAAVLNRS